MPRQKKRPAESDGSENSGPSSKSLKPDSTYGSSHLESLSGSSVATAPPGTHGSNKTSSSLGTDPPPSVHTAGSGTTEVSASVIISNTSTSDGVLVYRLVERPFASQSHLDHYWNEHAKLFKEAGKRLENLLRNYKSDNLIGEEAQRTDDAIRCAIDKATNIYCDLGLCCGKRKPTPRNKGKGAREGPHKDECKEAKIDGVSKVTTREQYEVWKRQVALWKKSFEDAQRKKTAAEHKSRSDKVEEKGEEDENDAQSQKASVEEGEPPVTAEGHGQEVVEDAQSEGALADKQSA